MSDHATQLEEISSMLTESELFGHLPAIELSAAAHYFGVNEITQDETVFEEGDVGNFMCIVHSGSIAVTKANQEKQPVEMLKLGPGRAFGEMAVLDKEYRSVTCRAAEDTILLTLSKEALDELLEEHPRVGSRIVRAIAVDLSHRLRTATGQLADHIV